jgi:3-hydroxybutyryl-CoA dehydratase
MISIHGGKPLNPHMSYYKIGDTATIAKTVSEFDTYAWAGITGDFYGVHVNEEHAKKTQFGTRIVHGSLLVGFIGTLMGYMADKVPAPGAVSYRYDMTFHAPVFFGDTITARLELIEKREEKNECIFSATCTNQKGMVVASGQSILKVLHPEKMKKE